MKILMFHAEGFDYRPAVKSLIVGEKVPDEDSRPTLDDPPLPTPGAVDEDAIVVFVHAESGDAERGNKLITKCAKNVKWLANKRKIRQIVLHSFDHLSEDKASPEEANDIIERLAERLGGGGYAIRVTPFGYSSAWTLTVHGDPIAKVFKAL